MAFTCCLKCDACYGDNLASCPACGTHNFFCDEDTQIEAVNVLCDRMEQQAKEEKAEKLKQLAALRPSKWGKLFNWLKGA